MFHYVDSLDYLNPKEKEFVDKNIKDTPVIRCTKKFTVPVGNENIFLGKCQVCEGSYYVIFSDLYSILYQPEQALSDGKYNIPLICLDEIYRPYFDMSANITR